MSESRAGETRRQGVDELLAEVRERRRRHWSRILLSEGSGRPIGRRPRDPEQEEVLLERDRRKLERFLARYRYRREGP